MQLENKGRASALGEWDLESARWSEISEHCNKSIRPEWKRFYDEMFHPEQFTFPWLKDAVLTRGKHLVRALSSGEELHKVGSDVGDMMQVLTKQLVVMQLECDGAVLARPRMEKGRLKCVHNVYFFDDFFFVLYIDR